MQDIINKILEFHLVLRYIEIVSSLDKTQIWILIIITIVLVSYLVYRLMGVGMFFVFLFIVMISYIIYKANLFSFYEKQNEEFDARMHAVQVELDKSDSGK